MCAEYRKKYPEKVKAAKERWRKANLKKYVQYHRNWAIANPEKRAAINRRHLLKNSAYINAKKAKRMAAKVHATPSWANHFFIEEIYDLARLRTKYLGVKHSVDHVVPLTSDLVCGLHVEHNLRVIPHIQNIAKKNRHWPDMP